MFWAVLLSLIVVSISAIYSYIKWKYFTLRGSVRGLEPEFLYGNLRQLGIITTNKILTDSFIHGLTNMQKQYGDIFQFWMGANHFYVFCRPEHAEEIYANRHLFDHAKIRATTFGLIAENAIINLTGLKYKRHAKAVLPMLRKNKFKSKISIMTDCVDCLINVWKQRYENKNDTSCTCLVNDNQQLMLDLFTLITFDYDFGNLKRLSEDANLSDTEDKSAPSELGQALSVWLDALGRVTINGMPMIVNYYLLKFDRKYQKAINTLETYAEKIVVKCQEEADLDEKPVSLVASLVSSLQKDEVLEQSKPETEKIGISKKELLDEVLGLILGGYETTSSVLSWLMHYLSKKPSIQQRIKEELQQNGIIKETPLDNFDVLDKCEYIDCVIKEILRIAPLTNGSIRTLTQDIIIDGVKIRKGESVVSAFSLMQNDPRNWKLDPTQFIPERFYGIDAPDANHHSFVFAPFGGGHRACIGQDLAQLELKVIIIRLMQFVTFIDAPGNNGGHLQRMTVIPKELVVSIEFD